MCVVFKVCNVSDVGNDIMAKMADPETGLPLKAALNWAKTEGERARATWSPL